MIQNLEEILKRAQKAEKLHIAVAAADDAEVLECAREAVDLDLADFKLVGPEGRLKSLIAEMKLGDWAEKAIVPAGSVEEAARMAVDLVVKGQAKVLMKGQLQTGTFLKAVLDKEKGLRGPNLLGQCGVYDKEGGGLFLATDCAMNISPNLDQKRQLIENAVALARALEIEKPKVAALTALETVNPDMPETLEAAALSKMADRGQIKNCLVDGPLALDNAVSLEAARHKGVGGEVAGQADILLAPDLKTGNVLHKALVYFAHRRNAALVLGAKAPIVMTSRTDPVSTKVFSIALAALAAQGR